MNYQFGPYFVDTERLELKCSNDLISVQPQVFSLLVFLIENCERVVSKDEIIENVWNGRIVGDGTLNARINALRRALGDDGATQNMIKTLPRQGFRFVGEIENRSTDNGGERNGSGREPLAINEASVAVLPFVNISAYQEQDYFADGMTEDLITDLSKIPELFVIARNSSFS